MCCVQRHRLLSPYCISQFSLLLIHTHLVPWDMRRQACWVTDASQKRVWGPEAHSVIWSNTHVMVRHREPHRRRQRRRIIWEWAFCVCEPVGTSACSGVRTAFLTLRVYCQGESWHMTNAAAFWATGVPYPWPLLRRNTNTARNHFGITTSLTGDSLSHKPLPCFHSGAPECTLSN